MIGSLISLNCKLETATIPEDFTIDLNGSILYSPPTRHDNDLISVNSDVFYIIQEHPHNWIWMWKLRKLHQFNWMKTDAAFLCQLDEKLRWLHKGSAQFDDND